MARVVRRRSVRGGLPHLRRCADCQRTEARLRVLERRAAGFLADIYAGTLADAGAKVARKLGIAPAVLDEEYARALAAGRP
jgi:hypothetical protein